MSKNAFYGTEYVKNFRGIMPPDPLAGSGFALKWLIHSSKPPSVPPGYASDLFVRSFVLIHFKRIIQEGTYYEKEQQIKEKRRTTKTSERKEEVY